MQDMLLAIWQQDFDQLIQMQAVGLLVTCLVVILFLESSFVFLPLPGDSLVLLAGGLVGWGARPRGDAALHAAGGGLGSLIAYVQGQALHGTAFMGHVERMIRMAACRGLPPAAQLRLLGHVLLPFRALRAGADPHADGGLASAPAAGNDRQFCQRLPLGPGAESGGQGGDGGPGVCPVSRVADQVPASDLLGLFVIAMAAIAIRLLKRPTNRIR